MSKTWIALLRGINVGGNNIVKMASLREELGQIGLLNVKTYIQSGNVVFSTEGRSSRGALEKQIASLLSEQFNVASPVLVLSEAELDKAIANNPFAEEELEPKTLHFYFLYSKPKKVDWKQFEKLAANQERYELKDRTLYFSAPDGLARSKLAVSMEKLLGVHATGRNLRTVSKIAELISG